MQQINLYLPEFRPRRDYFSAENSVLLLAAVLGLMIFLRVQQGSELGALTAEVDQLEARYKTVNEQVTALKKTPAVGRSATLEREIVRTRDAIRNREAIAELMAGQSLGNQRGFSSQLLALGEHRLEDISLQSFELQNGGSFARIAGVSLKAESVPLYVTRLQGDPCFANTRFGFLTLQNTPAGMQFLLSGDGPVNTEMLAHTAESLTGGKR